MKKMTKREKYLVTQITRKLAEIREEKNLVTRPDQYNREKSYFLAGYEEALKLILYLIEED